MNVDFGKKIGIVGFSNSATEIANNRENDHVSFN